MNTISIIVAVLALIGLAVVWLRLATVNAKIDALDDLHRGEDHANSPQKPVNLSLLSRKPSEPPVEVPLAATEKFIVLGYRHETIVVDNQPQGKGLAVKTVRIEIPAGTTHVVPSIKGISIAYGALIPGPDDEYGWDPADHHFGLASTNIHVREVGQVTATLEVTMLLRDYNGDDAWGGGLVTTILFLGPHPQIST